MHAYVRPYASATVALIGAAVLGATPMAQPPLDARIATPAVSLAAASFTNVPANLMNAFLNMPAAEVAAIERFAAAMESSGSWNQSSPNNVWGWDPANPEMLKGFVDVLLPFPALSGPLGEHLNWWAAANLPMYAGCAFECPDPVGMLNNMFRVPPWEFYDADGYTFGPVINPVDGQPTEWSGQTVKLDPFEPIQSVIDFLLNEPGVVTFPTASEVITAVANLAFALQTTEQLPPWIPVGGIESFLKLFVPTPETSSIPAPDSARTFTLDVSDRHATLANEVVSPNAEQVGIASTGVVSPDAQQNGLAVADARTPDSATSNVLAAVQDKVAPEPAKGPDTAIAATEPASTTPSAPVIDLTKDGNKVEPIRVGPKHRNPGGGLTGALTSMHDAVNASISKITDGLKSGDTN
jgi:hypothetical protein